MCMLRISFSLFESDVVYEYRITCMVCTKTTIPYKLYLRRHIQIFSLVYRWLYSEVEISFEAEENRGPPSNWSFSNL